MNCRHHHCRVLTVGEYVRIYEAAMGGPCPFVAGRWEHEPISRRCLKCNAQVSLGPSDEAPVAVEVRAAEIAASNDPMAEMSRLDERVGERIGWKLRAIQCEGRGLGLVPGGANMPAGYLAHAIVNHDNEQGTAP